MADYFVTRHRGAQEWAKAQGIEAECLDSLDLDRIRAGDRVYGVLPFHLAAAVVRRKAAFYHLEIDVPADRRGADLSAAEMTRFGARLVRYDVSPHAELPPPAQGRPGVRAMLTRLCRHLRSEHGVALFLGASALATMAAPAGVGFALQDVTFEQWPLLIALIGDFLALTILFGLVARWSDRSRIRWCWGLGALLAMGAAHAWSWPQVWPLTVWYGVFAGALGLLWAVGRGLLRVEVRQQLAGHLPPRPVVVVALSALLDRPSPDGQPLPLTVDPTGEGFVGTHALVETLNMLMGDGAFTLAAVAAPQALAGRSMLPWQQNIRVLASQFAGDRLRTGHVVVLPSRESHGQFPAFKRLVERLAAREGITLTIEKAQEVDMFDLAAVETAIRATVHRLTEEGEGRSAWTYDEILIDVTSGPKLPSIAAAAATFTSDLTFSYVEQDKVWLIDARARLGTG